MALALQQQCLVRCRQRLSIRWLTTTTTTTTTALTTTTTTSIPKIGTRIIKRRKRSRQRPHQHFRLTIKDRIRLLERNSLEKDAMIIAKRTTIQAASFLETRLKEAQSLVRGFWDRGDARRNEKLKMDRWWWTWNICFALAPAGMIAVYMELWGIPLVEARSKELELYRRTKVGLLETLNDDNDDEDDLDHDDDAGDIKTETQADNLPLTLSGAANLPSTVSSTQKLSSRDSSNSSTPNASQEIPSQITSTDPAIAELYNRIQLLEKKLERQKRQKDKERRLQDQRANQSGIKNRSDDKFLLQEVERRKQEKAAHITSPEAELASKPTLYTIAQAYMQKNAQSKLDALHEFGQQLLSSLSRREQNTNDDDSETTNDVSRPTVTGTVPAQTVSDSTMTTTTTISTTESNHK